MHAIEILDGKSRSDDAARFCDLDHGGGDVNTEDMHTGCGQVHRVITRAAAEVEDRVAGCKQRIDFTPDGGPLRQARGRGTP
jgi:hypothetical protein